MVDFSTSLFFFAIWRLINDFHQSTTAVPQLKQQGRPRSGSVGIVEWSNCQFDDEIMTELRTHEKFGGIFRAMVAWMIVRSMIQWD